MISYNFKDCNVLCYRKYYTVKQTSMNIVFIRTRVRHEPQKRNGKHYNWKKLFHGSCKIGPRIIRKQLKNRCWTPVLRLLSPPTPPPPPPSPERWRANKSPCWSLMILHLLYCYMRNFCNLIGLEEWYFNLSWNTYMWKLQILCG